MPKYECPNEHLGAKITNWLPFAWLVEVRFPGVSFPFKGIFSKDSVIVLIFRFRNGRWEVATIRERRPLFHKGELTAFPAGKIEDQTPAAAARAEAEQETGLKVKHLKLGNVAQPFLHLVSEKVYTFICEVDEADPSALQLEEGEFISGLHWIGWDSLCAKVVSQLRSGEPAVDGAPMMGTSLDALCRVQVAGLNLNEVFRQ